MEGKRVALLWRSWWGGPGVLAQGRCEGTLG